MIVKNLWLGDIFENQAFEQIRELAFEGIILSLDPSDDYFLPLSQCIKLMEQAAKELIKVKLKIFNTSFEAINVLLTNLSQYKFDLILSDAQILHQVLEIHSSCYLYSVSKEIPYIMHVNFKGYILENSDDFFVSDNYQIGIYLSHISKVDFESESDFMIVKLANYQTGYRQIDYQNFIDDMKKVKQK